MSSRKVGKVKDKWRLKGWFTVHAPPYFGGHEIAIIPGPKEGGVEGRIVEVTLYDLTKQDISQINTKLYFKIQGIQGTKADTIFNGHEYSREFLRSLVRRGSSRVDMILSVKTKDDYQLRVYAVALSRRRLKPSQETGIRKIMEQTIQEKCRNLTLDQLAQELALGKVASDIFNKSTKVVPLRHVGIRKSKLLSLPATATTMPTPTT